MYDAQNPSPRPVNPRRRRRTKMDIFKESYLPVIIVGVALLFILITIIGSAVQGAQRKKKNEVVSENNDPAPVITTDYSAEVQQLLQTAENYADNYYIDDAIKTINSFSGDIVDYPELMTALQTYCDIRASYVEWSDPSKVLNLSFQMLIEDPLRAFKDAKYGSAYNKNYITTSEFRIILDQLYANGYVLVSLNDIAEYNGTKMEAKTLMLPEGKKPLILTQTQVNYYAYMIDSDDEDTLPDKDGAGFASKLVLDSNGKLANEYVDKNGNTLIGEYDLIPILNSYISAHPDFSYQGARAVIAVTGEEGVFGYRTNAGAKDSTETNYNDEVSAAKQIADALKEEGYELACNTYYNRDYSQRSLDDVNADLKLWMDEVSPILGKVNIMVFALNDIAGSGSYSGSKYNALKNAGFQYYLGFAGSGGTPYAYTDEAYFRQARIIVSGGNLKHNGNWFSQFLKPVEILSSTRGTIPQP